MAATPGRELFQRERCVSICRSALLLRNALSEVTRFNLQDLSRFARANLSLISATGDQFLADSRYAQVLAVFSRSP